MRVRMTVGRRMVRPPPPPPMPCADMADRVDGMTRAEYIKHHIPGNGICNHPDRPRGKFDGRKQCRCQECIDELVRVVVRFQTQLHIKHGTVPF